jgi:hypothetical protein
MKYYAKGIDIDGNDVDLTVGCFGSLYCNDKKLVSLESNATSVQCWNNCLTELNLPNAKTVYCWDNCLTKLIAPNATTVSCQDNNLTELNLPNATHVNCFNNKLSTLILPNAGTVHCSNRNLKSILNLILSHSINQSKLYVRIIMK